MSTKVNSKQEFDFILNNIKIQIYKNKMNLQDESNLNLVREMYLLIANNINFTTEQDRNLYLTSLERNKGKLKGGDYRYFHSTFSNKTEVHISKKRSPSPSKEEENPRKKFRSTLSKIELKHKLRMIELNIIRGKWMSIPQEEGKRRLMEYYSCLEENISLVEEEEKKVYLTSLEKNKEKMEEDEYQHYKNILRIESQRDEVFSQSEEETEEEEYNEEIKGEYATYQINNDIFYGKHQTISALIEKAKDIRRDNIIPLGCSGGDIHNINRKSLIPYHIELSDYGNLIHLDTGFVVDFKGRFKVIGKEDKDRKVIPLNEKDVEECKKHNLRYPFLYPIFFQQFVSTSKDDWKTIYKLIQDYPSCYSRFNIMTKPIKKI